MEHLQEERMNPLWKEVEIQVERYNKNDKILLMTFSDLRCE